MLKNCTDQRIILASMDSVITEHENKKLRHTLGRFATGVAVVTTSSGGNQPSGLTINSFSSVSLDPPLILWSLSLNSARRDIFESAEYFAINILAGDQLDLCQHFSSTIPDLFSDIAWQPSPNGQPILDGVVASLECRTWNLVEGGDHIIILGEVLAHHHNDKAPLIFAKGQLTSL
jgi:flavin reductase (DIM6/NTAB) family NADH-FMN oxidoreductase RutF